jgi:hypothetical protein
LFSNVLIDYALLSGTLSCAPLQDLVRLRDIFDCSLQSYRQNGLPLTIICTCAVDISFETICARVPVRNNDARGRRFRRHLFAVICSPEEPWQYLLFFALVIKVLLDRPFLQLRTDPHLYAPVVIGLAGRFALFSRLRIIRLLL